jgi:hypothetical protein
LSELEQIKNVIVGGFLMTELQEFLKISRYVILDSVSLETRKEISNFILKKSTDYQILSLLLETKIPVKYSSKHEKALLTELYRQISIGYEYLNEQDSKTGVAGAVGMLAPSPITAALAGGSQIVTLLKVIGAKTGAAGIATALHAGGSAALIGGIGSIVLAALLVYAAWKTYQRFFSPAARACKHLKIKGKTKCIIRFRIHAREKQYADLISARRACDKSKTPIKCKRILEEKIKRVYNRINRMKEKLEAFSS